MEAIKNLLSTEVKSKNNTTVENTLNCVLTPAQYLFNGKKVDWIQVGDQKALQIDDIYKGEKTLLKTIVMVVLLVPTSIIGGAFKVLLVRNNYSDFDISFIQKCLKKENGVIYVPKGHRAFAEKIYKYIQSLQSTKTWNVQFNKEGLPFLSEITDLRLLYETHHPSTLDGRWRQQFNNRRKNKNTEILDNIELLWNLSHMNLADRYIQDGLCGNEMEKLCTINPNVIFLKIDQSGAEAPKFSEKMSAVEFFSSLRSTV